MSGRETGRIVRRNEIVSRLVLAIATGGTALVIGGGLISHVADAQQRTTEAAATAVVELQPNPPRVPPPPERVGAAKAYSVLDRHCARCHQDGRLKTGYPSHGFANVLALDELARDRALVQPGAPDASRLYTSILSRAMPFDVYHATAASASAGPAGAPGGSQQVTPGGGQASAQAGSGQPPVVEEPSADEIQALRDWIAELPTGEPGRCAGRERLSQDKIADTIAAAVSEAGPDKAKSLRFMSVAHLFNACATPGELAGFRQGATDLVNSLSWNAAPVRLEAIGPEQVILKLVLPDVGWIAAHWEQLAAAYPLRSSPAARLPRQIQDQTGTRTPLIAADWMADAAMRPPLYYELLGLPSRFANLQRILRVDVDADIRRGLARRAGITQSGETRGSRVIERHPSSTGGLWLSYDLAAAGGRPGVLDHPLGPVSAEPSRAPFKYEGMKALFHLPNGFPAFSLNDARGDRIDRGVGEVERDLSSRGQAMYAGGNCLQCHRGGPLSAKDEVRVHIEADRTASKELRDGVGALYATDAEFARLIEADQARTSAAMTAVGLDPNLRVWGLDPVRALGRAWQRRVDLLRAASDFGVDPPALLERLSGVGPDSVLAAHQLRQGVARRDDVVRLFGELAAAQVPEDRIATPPQPTPSGQAAASDRLDLVVWSDADSYVAGQAATFHAQPSQDCHLTLINVDKSGRATVLFPNEFEPNNLIAAGRDHRIPSTESPYRFRLKERGRESFVGICTKTARAPDGVFHDFERLRFTVLGDWQIFLREPPALEEARRDDSAAERPRPQQRRARSKVEAPKPVQGPDVQARTAISVDVR